MPLDLDRAPADQSPLTGIDRPIDSSSDCSSDRLAERAAEAQRAGIPASSPDTTTNGSALAATARATGGKFAWAARRSISSASIALARGVKAVNARGPGWAKAFSTAAARSANSLADGWSRIRPRLGLKSLYWRIFVVNLTGLAVMLVGILYLSAQQDWLIEAKRESIQSQAQVIADAIVREATSEERGFAFPDPDKMLDGNPAAVDPKVFDIHDVEFAIQPEKVAPILQRYSQTSGQRARIYARDGTLIYDSAGLSNRVTRKVLSPVGEPEGESLAVDSFWMRLDSILMPSNLPIYKEIGRGNGRAYPEVVAALEGAPTPMLMVNRRGSHMVSVAVPIQRLRAVQGALLLSSRDGDIDGIRRKERHLLTWIFLIAVAATALTALLLASTIARPMRKLSDAALAVKRNIATAQDLPTFSEHKDEIGQMASAFRDMTLALFKRIELSEKFAADVAHELKNPVTAVRSATESLSYVKDPKDRDELIQNIQTDLKRLNKLITDISNFSRLDAELKLQEAEPVDLGALARGLATTFNDMRGTEENPAPVVLDLERGPTGQERAFIVAGHEGRLGQVLTNLIDNALSFSPPTGHVHVSIALRDGGRDAAIELRVDDEGPGIPEDRLEKIFARFYTDRPDSEATQGKNSGLGLSITREIIEAHSGSVHAENRVSSDGKTVGARFVVLLPASGGGQIQGLGRRSARGSQERPAARRADTRN